MDELAYSSISDKKKFPNVNIEMNLTKKIEVEWDFFVITQNSTTIIYFM